MKECEIVRVHLHVKWSQQFLANNALSGSLSCRGDDCYRWGGQATIMRLDSMFRGCLCVSHSSAFKSCRRNLHVYSILLSVVAFKTLVCTWVIVPIQFCLASLKLGLTHSCRRCAQVSALKLQETRAIRWRLWISGEKLSVRRWPFLSI